MFLKGLPNSLKCYLTQIIMFNSVITKINFYLTEINQYVLGNKIIIKKDTL